MSAFMVSPEHIRCLVTALHALESMPGDRPRAEWRDVSDIYRAETRALQLARACAISVDHRYGGGDSTANLDEFYAYRPVPWPVNGVSDAKVLAKVLQLCQCYAYQACEHPTWEDSPAFAIIADIEKRASHRLAGLLASDTWSTDSARIFVTP